MMNLHEIPVVEHGELCVGLNLTVDVDLCNTVSHCQRCVSASLRDGRFGATSVALLL